MKYIILFFILLLTSSCMDEKLEVAKKNELERVMKAGRYTVVSCKEIEGNYSRQGDTYNCEYAITATDSTGQRKDFLQYIFLTQREDGSWVSSKLVE